MQLGRHPQNPPQLHKNHLARQGLETQQDPISYFSAFPEPIRKRSDGWLTSMKQVQGSTRDIYCMDLKGLLWHSRTSQMKANSAIFLQLAVQTTDHLLHTSFLIGKKCLLKKNPNNKMYDIHLECIKLHVHRKVTLKCFTDYSSFSYCTYSLSTLLSYPNHCYIQISYKPSLHLIFSIAHLPSTKHSI